MNLGKKSTAKKVKKVDKEKEAQKRKVIAEKNRAKAQAKKLKKENKRAKAKAKSRANARKNIENQNSEKFVDKSNKNKKTLRPSTRGWLCLFGSILMLALLVFMLVVVILTGMEAPSIFGSIGIFNMAFSFVFIYLGATALKEDGHSTLYAKIGMGISALVIVSYVFFYSIGLG